MLLKELDYDIVPYNSGIYNQDMKFICPFKYYRQYQLDDHEVLYIDVDENHPKYLQVVINTEKE